MADDGQTPKQKKTISFITKIRNSKTLPVNLLLFSAGFHGRIDQYGRFTKAQCGGRDFLEGLVGTIFQTRLKDETRKNSDEYICKTCHGTGVLTSFEGSVRSDFTGAIKDLLQLPAENISFGSINQLFGFDADKNFQDELFENIGKAFHLSKKSIEKNKAKNKKRFIKQEIPKHIEDIGNQLKQNFGNFNEFALVIQPCGACNANGYYDIGHVFDFGKQVDLMLYIYRKYILNGTGTWEEKWNSKVNLDELYSRFFDLKVQPEIPKRVPNIKSFTKAQALAISHYKVNRDKLYMGIIKSVKKELYKKFEKIYDDKGQLELDSSVPSFLEVYKFFVRMSRSARVATGTLQKELDKQTTHIYEHYLKFKALYKTENMAQTPFPSAGFVVEGPSVGQRLGDKAKGSAKSILFVYGSMYIPNKYKEGKGPVDVKWSKSESIDQILAKSFSKNSLDLIRTSNFITYFPQRFT